MSSICDSCHAGCCRTYRLTITIFDFLDLVNAIGLQKAIQGTSFEAIPYDASYLDNVRGIHPFIFDDPDKKEFMYSLSLKRIESKIFPGTKMCSFLHEEGRLVQKEGTKETDFDHPGKRVSGLCSIYSHRPMMCRTYPFNFNPNKMNSFLKRRDDLPQSQEKEAYKICPKTELSLADFDLKNPNDILQKNNDLMVGYMRNLAHNKVVHRWNSQTTRLNTDIVSFFLAVGNSLIGSYKSKTPLSTVINEQIKQKPPKKSKQKSVEKKKTDPTPVQTNYKQAIAKTKKRPKKRVNQE